MSRQVLFIFIIISTFTIACGSSDDSSSDGPWGGDLTDGGYPAIVGGYSMDTDGYDLTCSTGTPTPNPAVPGVPISITQDENNFTVKYFAVNPETDTGITNWTQDCSIETDGSFTCAEEYDFQGGLLLHVVLTIEGYFTPGGMVGAVTQTNTSGSTTCTGEYGISLTGYPDIAGEYSMERDGYTVSCNVGGDVSHPAASGLPIAITQDGNNFTVKYFLVNAETETDVTNWTQDCTLDSESNFTCTEEYDFPSSLHSVLTVEGSFTADGMVGVVTIATTGNSSSVACDTGEFGISFTN